MRFSATPHIIPDSSDYCSYPPSGVEMLDFTIESTKSIIASLVFRLKNILVRKTQIF